MKRKLTLFLLFAVLCTFNLAAASWISLSNSDAQPWEQTFPGQCSKPAVTVVHEKDNKTQPKVIEVVLTGDFTNCLGQQVLVSAYKTGNIYSYGVKEITGPVSEIIFRFDKGDGDMRQKFPVVVNHRLVPDGPLAPPTTSISASDVVVVFGETWQ